MDGNLLNYYVAHSRIGSSHLLLLVKIGRVIPQQRDETEDQSLRFERYAKLNYFIFVVTRASHPILMLETCEGACDQDYS